MDALEKRFHLENVPYDKLTLPYQVFITRISHSRTPHSSSIRHLLSHIKPSNSLYTSPAQLPAAPKHPAPNLNRPHSRPRSRNHRRPLPSHQTSEPNCPNYLEPFASTSNSSSTSKTGNEQTAIHSASLRSWLSSKSPCPMCRAPLFHPFSDVERSLELFHRIQGGWMRSGTGLGRCGRGPSARAGLNGRR